MRRVCVEMTFNDESERSQFLLDEEGFSDSDTESQSQVGLTPPPDQSAKAKLKALLFGGLADTAPPATVSSTATPEYKLYPWRWLMLVSMFLLNISNGTVSKDRLCSLASLVGLVVLEFI